MRILMTTVAVLALAGPALANHANGTPPGKAAKEEAAVDRNGDGKINGRDYAPGFSAAADNAEDLNGDGKINGKDYAPGQR